MRCPTCREQMRCLDTRWNDTARVKYRRWQCACGLKGKTQETWVDAPAKPKPKPKVRPKPVKQDPLTQAFYGKPAKIKKEKDVSVRHKPMQSLFESTDEDSVGEDFSDLGLDIPRGGDW